ncbi:MAG: bifunctional folylpolyglutamate synthase/dihydrofolate synthase [Parcubacteria group bacterium Gr01-1014_73]|nr:MAG: bifunctional folylpolyglutamate synthase/dihydrofolate synthase [Parcubacteria group bacterium Gr01-1014_73]
MRYIIAMNQSVDSKKYARYYAAVRYLESLGNISGGYQKTNLKSHPKPEMFLERMQDFLDLVGNPEVGFKYIHITGTAGKGSVAAAVHQSIVRAGKKSGLFTSPFTVSTIEKIQVGDKYIDSLVFADILDELKPMIDETIKSSRHGAPSYFELMLALALVYFKKQRCEYVVLEVGLGGRYDATNIIKKPIITAITNIGLDHTNILGNKREDIAWDKAGIIKRQSEFFTTEENSRILNIFKSVCSEVGAEYHSLDVNGLDYAMRNLSLAGSICGALGIANAPEEIGPMPQLPARFEIVERNPIVIVDGAHNPSKIESTLFNLKNLRYRKLFLIIAVSVDKDWKTIMRLIAPRADNIYVTRFSVSGRQSVSPDLLMKEAKKYCQVPSKVELRSDPVQAFNDAKKKLSKGDALLITGSFYLAGDIRSLYYSEDRILRRRKSF